MHSHVGPVHGSMTKHPWFRSNHHRLVWACQCPTPKVLRNRLYHCASAVHIATQQIKLATFIYSIITTALTLVNGLVNSGSHFVTWFLVPGAQNFGITGLESTSASPEL